MSWLAKVREHLRGVLFRDRVNAETREEMRFHVDMEAERRARELGMDPIAARREAQLAFGGVERHAEAVRDARGFNALNGVSLDVKLGGRMLRKYPMLTVAGGLSLALAVALAASFFEFFGEMTRPQLSLPDAHEVVTIQNLDLASGGSTTRTLHDFEAWREGMRSLRDLSAIVVADYSIVTDDGAFTTLQGAAVHAGAFRVAGSPPLLGRTFTEADEQPGAETPVVLSYGVWQEQFGAALDVVGRSLKVGATHATVVGVMPEGFGFPINEQIWVPLRERASAYERGKGPLVTPVARLARGVDVEQAQAEMDVIAERLARDFPQTNEHIRARVRPMGDAIGMSSLVQMMNIPFILFLIVVCANIATLVFARTAARSGELALRSALGASRRRLVLQLIAESLVLTGTATVLGLFAAQYGYGRAMALFWEVQQSVPPFWFDDDLSATTIGYALLLSLVAATIIGGIPALKATGKHLRHRLAEAGAGAGRLNFGRVSTAVIIVQVAICVIFLPYAFLNARGMILDGDNAVAFPASDFLSGRVLLHTIGHPELSDEMDPAVAERRRMLFEEVKRRAAAQPAVIRAAMVSQLPGFNHGTTQFTLASDTAKARSARFVGVDADFFELVNARVIAGRSFAPAEYESGADVLIVDAEWAAKELPGRSPLGERVMLRAPNVDTPFSHEIIGVVENIDPAIGPGSQVAFFQPLSPGRLSGVQLYMRTAQTPLTLVPQVHAAITGVDPAVGVDQLRPLDDIWQPVIRSEYFLVGMINVVAFVIMGFALIGIYALMSFTVAQRTREIAIRSALGARPRKVVTAIFARAAVQIGVGIAVGAAIITIVLVRVGESPIIVAGVSALMLVVGLAGCALPVARALRIQPTHALKAD
jgi:predicted permease